MLVIQLKRFQNSWAKLEWDNTVIRGRILYNRSKISSWLLLVHGHQIGWEYMRLKNWIISPVSINLPVWPSFLFFLCLLSFIQSVSQSISQLVSQSVSRLVSQSVSQSVKNSVIPSIIHPISQTVSQLVSHSFTQSPTHFSLHSFQLWKL